MCPDLLPVPFRDVVQLPVLLANIELGFALPSPLRRLPMRLAHADNRKLWLLGLTRSVLSRHRKSYVLAFMSEGRCALSGYAVPYSTYE